MRIELTEDVTTYKGKRTIVALVAESVLEERLLGKSEEAFMVNPDAAADATEAAREHLRTKLERMRACCEAVQTQLSANGLVVRYCLPPPRDGLAMSEQERGWRAEARYLQPDDPRLDEIRRLLLENLTRKE